MVQPDAEEEAAFLADKFAAKRLPAETGKVRAFISKPGNFDLLHIVCHGEADSAAIADAKLLMTGRLARDTGEYIEDPFTAKVAARFCDIAAADNAPMVVLNACQVGRQGYQLTSIGGFSEAFLKGGAGAFVGTLWSVGDTPASTFTTELYERLLANSTLAEATIAGRKAARKERDATWLAYVVYGHPYMTIAR
jgi:CHAT domain-containing protein